MYVILKDVNFAAEVRAVYIDIYGHLTIYYSEKGFVTIYKDNKPYIPSDSPGRAFKGYPKESYNAIITAIEAGRPSVALNLNNNSSR